MAKKSKGIPGVSFSMKRALGISQAQSKLSRQVGVPLSKAGRQRKIGSATGCLVPAAFLIISAALAAAAGIASAIAGN